MSERSLLQLRCMLLRSSGLLTAEWPGTSERLLCRAEGDDEAQGARGVDFSSIADPFGDQESGGGSNNKRADRQNSREEHGDLQHPQHGNHKQSGHQDQAEEDFDDGQTMLFLKVTAGDCVLLGACNPQPCAAVTSGHHCVHLRMACSDCFTTVASDRQVSLSEQKHKSSMKLLGSDVIHWRAHFPFVVRNSINICVYLCKPTRTLPTHFSKVHRMLRR